jgi:3-oxoadipate enol-lactonase
MPQRRRKGFILLTESIPRRKAMKIRANGIEMNFELSGCRDGQVVMMSHSLGSSLAMWTPQMAALEPHFRVLRYDVRGHGESEAPAGPYTLDLLAEDATGLLDALGIGTCHWVGLSMGGMIGQAMALDHSERLLSLSLCDTAAAVGQDAQPVWQERIDTVRTRGVAALAEGTLERWFTPPFLQQNGPEVQLIRKVFLSTPPEGFMGCIGAIRRLNTLDRLGEIRLPVLIAVGEDDQGTPVAASEAMRSRIDGARLVILPSARHLSNVEQPEAFNAALRAFLRGI